MNKKTILLIIISIFLLLPMSVYGDCQSDFDQIASQFTYSYEYNKDTDDFTITLNNPQYYAYVYILPDKYSNSYNMSGGSDAITLTINNYKEDEYPIKISSLSDSCKWKVVKEEKIKLYKYNEYSDSDQCAGNEDFILCQRDYDKKIDVEEFEERLEAYKNSKVEDKKEETIETSEGETKTNDKLVDYIKANMTTVIILAAFVVVLIITLIVTILNIKKSRRLE